MISRPGLKDSIRVKTSVGPGLPTITMSGNAKRKLHFQTLL